MRVCEPLNTGWMFHYGEIERLPKTAKKAACIGGITSTLEHESGPAISMGAGGKFFYELIGTGKEESALLKMLANTNSTTMLTGWEAIELPHDWKADMEYSRAPDIFMSGAVEDGVGYYRRVFSLPKEDIGKHISIEFNGVCRAASVWFNGCFIGDHYSGYTGFSFDLTDLLRFGDEGDNVLLVRADTTTGAEGWWYEGAGIYRDVNLVKTNMLHIPRWGTWVHTTKLAEGNAEIAVETEIENRGYESKKARLEVQLIASDGTIVGKAFQEFKLKPLDKTKIENNIHIAAPQLWRLGNPVLYRAVNKIYEDGVCIDEYENTFGIRTVEYRTDGFYLNGEQTVLKGVCIHQDFAGVGVALPAGLQYHKVCKLREMGCNAIRNAHHPADSHLLAACDELGIMIMNENRLLESSELRLQELKDMVKQSRNHPSVIMWSLSNEEFIGGSIQAGRMLRHMACVLRNLDNTRPVVSAEIIPPDGEINEEYLSIFNVLGLNYPESNVMGGGLEAVRKKWANAKLLNTETCSYFSTRGAYTDNWEKRHTNNFGSRFSMISDDIGNEQVGAGGTSRPERAFEFLRSAPYSGGVFVWTGFDYRGEPSPFPWPAVRSQFGIMDNCGNPKDYYYYYKANWTEEALIHIMPHWTWTGEEGREKLVRIFSNCDEVELLVNGKSVGVKPVRDNICEWRVEYQPGKIEAKALKNGKETASQIHETAGLPISICLTKENSDVRGIAVIVAEVLDINGCKVPTADTQLTFTVDGAARLLGTGNGDPIDHTSEHSALRRLFFGKANCVIKIDGEATLTVSADGMSNISLKL